MNKTVRPDASLRYMQVFDELRIRIEKGIYPIETALPTEGELCAEFGASRYTIREALRRLVEQGMVRRRQGSGSIVAATQPQRQFVHSLASLQGLLQYALNTHYQILSIEVVELDEDLAEDIGGEAGSEWTLIRGIRRTRKRGKIVGFVHSYVPARLARFVPELETCVGAFYAHLSKRAREDIIEADQSIRGARMDAEMASYLGGRRGDGAICSIRRYFGPKGVVITSFNWHDIDDFSFYMKLHRSM